MILLIIAFRILHNLTKFQINGVNWIDKKEKKNHINKQKQERKKEIERKKNES
jgi:hypothetical protein